MNPKKISDYRPKILLIKYTKDPLKVISLASNLTMKKSPTFENDKISELVYNLFIMNHHSIFEHINYTFLIQNVSRSFMAQLTRHRIGSFTCSSQHYQHYSDYGFAIDNKWANNVFVQQSVDYAVENYNLLRRAGCPKEEARQVLPNGMMVNILWTVNARSLINFLNLRLCKRNVKEIIIVAKKIKELCIDHFPELFNYVGSDCFLGKCKQNKMSCQNVHNKSKTIKEN